MSDEKRTQFHDAFDEASYRVLQTAREFAAVMGATRPEDWKFCFVQAMDVWRQTHAIPPVDLRRWGEDSLFDPRRDVQPKTDKGPKSVDPDRRAGQLRLVVDSPTGNRYCWTGHVASCDNKVGFGISLDLTLEDVIRKFDALPAPDTIPGDKPWRGWVHHLRLREPDTTVEIDVYQGGVPRLAKKLR